MGALLVGLSPGSFASATIPRTFEDWTSVVAERLHEATWLKQRFETYRRADLAKCAGLSKASISRIAAGETVMSVEVGRSIATCLGVTHEWLLGYDILRNRFGDASVEEISNLENGEWRRALTPIKLALGGTRNIRGPRWPMCQAELDRVLDATPIDQLMDAIIRRRTPPKIVD